MGTMVACRSRTGTRRRATCSTVGWTPSRSGRTRTLRTARSHTTSSRPSALCALYRPGASRRRPMQTFRRTVAVLIFPAIAYLGAACQRDTPTEARPGRPALSVSGDLTDALSTDLGQSYQVILSCTDGHSVILWVDAATLTSLAGDVEAINASDTGVSCTLGSRALDPSSQTTTWTVYDYNPSNNALAPRNAPGKMPATTSGSETKFDFLPGKFPALLTPTDRSLTGERSRTTLTDYIRVSGPATTFMTQHNGGANCSSNIPAAVRFYFVSPSASGSTVGTPPAGFYTQFWWSNPMNLTLTAGNQTGTITANVGDPSEWSDWNGQPASSPDVSAAFEKAIHHVQTVGLSFGGLCFFETGVTAEYPSGTPPPDEVFSSTFSEMPTP